MIRRKAYKFKLKVKEKHINLLNQFDGINRFVWNKSLAINLHRLRNGYKIMYYQELDFYSKLWKKSSEYGFLKDCPSQTIQQKLRDLDKAFKDCFDKSQPNKKLPRFKKKGQCNGIRFPQGFKIQGNSISY
jgi:putative transposase